VGDAVQIVSRYELPIRAEDDIVIVRRKVRDLAQQQGLNVFATAAITTAASELARNVWTHARMGNALIEEISDGRRRGMRLEFRDEGPGIVDLERALAGGFSSARSLGLGLSGSRRLVDDFAIETSPGKGTVVTIVKWAAG
jgi:serine/threonine-protein kinase RsbT